MALSTTYLAKHTGAEIDAGIDLAQSAVQPADLNSKIAGLKNTDSAVPGQYVSAVKQENGVVTVERENLPAAYDDTTLKGKVTANEQAIEALQEKVETLPTEDTNTTYTFAEGTTNGAFNVTPSGGTAQSVKVHGLKDAAYKAASDFEEAGAAAAVKEEIEGELKSYAKDADVVKSATLGSKSFTKGANGALSMTAADGRSALGLGTAAEKNVGDFATTAQGTKADSALQKADIKEGSSNGNINVQGTDVPVKGLGSAAYTSSDAYDTKGSAAAVDAKVADLTTKYTNLKDTVDGLSGGSSNLGDRIQDIEDMIPEAASDENQLADKAFVNSSIENSAARFITPSKNGNSPWASLEALNASGATYYYGSTTTTPTNNDYAIFLKTESGVSGQTQWRASYQNGTWVEQYRVGSAFTAVQQGALDSGITKDLVTQIGTNKTDIGTLKNNVADRYTKTETDAKIDEKIKAIPAVPAASTTVAGIVKLGATGGAATYDDVEALKKQVQELVTLLSSGEYDIMFVKKATT